MTKCKCGYPETPCDKNRNDYLHDCVSANEQYNGGLRPQNIVQAAEADLARQRRNAEQAKYRDHAYEEYAFYRKHVRRATSPHGLLVLALMDPAAAEKTAKHNTQMIYGNARLLVDAIRMTKSTN